MRRPVANPAWALPCLALLVFVSGCAEKGYHQATAPAAPASAPQPAPTPPVPSPAAESKPSERQPVPAYRETGTASWFGREVHGRKTAGGQVIDMQSLTAFHRTLPLGTLIRVTNLDNRKTIELRVIDRGPFIANRILEVSFAAARELGFADQGTARVTIEAVDVPAAPSRFAVQAAVFSEEENADLLKDRLSKKYETITILPFSSNLGTLYRVLVGAYATEEKAQTVAARLRQEGLEPFVVRKD